MGSVHSGKGVVAALCLTSFGPLSLGLSCAGIFYPSLSADTGVSAGLLSYYTSAIWIAALVSLPVLGKLFGRIGPRACVAGASGLVALDFVALSFTGGFPWFMACGAVMGTGVAMLLFLAPSTLVNRWFSKRAGTLLGVVMAFTGVGGAVWCAVGGVVIDQFGWQVAYRLFAALSVLLGVVPAIALVRDVEEAPRIAPAVSRPSMENGRAIPSVARLSPATASRVQAARERMAEKGAHQPRARQPLPTQVGVSARRALPSGLLLLIADLAFILNFGMYIYFIIPSYAQDLPAAMAFPLLGAIASSVAMAGQTVSKIVLGYIGDRAPSAGAALGISMGIVGIGVLWFFTGQAAMVLVGAFLFGAYYGVANVMMPIFTRLGFGMRDYPRIYARVSMAASLGAIISGLLWGTVIGVTGGYAELFAGISILLCAALGLVFVLARRLETEGEANWSVATSQPDSAS